uniref:Uncharacterized protein n=1 Tax=Photinus pyralis TaxID=7054 RepID=A0A1Y1M7Q4_PHOPY
MNTFDEDQFAYKIHFSNNLDCDSDSDKSDFDEWYYKHKPPPLYINDDCDVVKIEPFTTVLYKRSISKVLQGASASLKKKSNTVSVSVHGNHVQLTKKAKKKKKQVGKAVVGSASKVNGPKVASATPKVIGNLQNTFDRPKLKEFTGYQESNPVQHPKKKLDQRNESLSKNVKPFSFSSIEWPALGTPSSTRSEADTEVDTLNFSPLANAVTILQDPKVRKKCDNTTPSQTTQKKNMKNKLILETVLRSDDSDSLRITAKRLQNSSSLFNDVKNSKLITKAKTKALQSTKESPPLFENRKKAGPGENFKFQAEDTNNKPTVTSILDNIHTIKKTRKRRSKRKKGSISKQVDNNKSNPIAFNLSSLKWPSLNELIDENNTQQKSAGNQQTKIDKNQKLRTGHEIKLEQNVTCTKLDDCQLKGILKPHAGSDCHDELKNGFWFLDIAESDCKSIKKHSDNQTPKITEPQVQKLNLSKLGDKQSTRRKSENGEQPHQIREVAVEGIKRSKRRRRKKGPSVNNLVNTSPTLPHEDDKWLNDTLCQEMGYKTEDSAVIEVKGQHKKKGASEISATNYKLTTLLSEIEKTPDIVDINREITVNCSRQEQNIIIITSFLGKSQVSKSIIPCSSSNNRTLQKNKTRKHKTPTQKTVESNKWRADQDLLLLEDFLPTFNRTPDNMEGNSVIPLNSFVTGGRDFFLLDKLFPQSSFSIHAKPRLAMSNMFLHFYTGYKNDIEILM